MSVSETHIPAFSQAAEGRLFHPDYYAQSDRLALFVELGGWNFLATVSGERLWLCDGLCRAAPRREPPTSIGSPNLAGDRP